MEEAFAEFSTGTGRFAGYDVIRDRGAKKPSSLAVSHEAALTGDFILLLREELEHIWEFV